MIAGHNIVEGIIILTITVNMHSCKRCMNCFDLIRTGRSNG